MSSSSIVPLGSCLMRSRTCVTADSRRREAELFQAMSDGLAAAVTAEHQLHTADADAVGGGTASRCRCS